MYTNLLSASAMFPSGGFLEKRLLSQCVQLFQGSLPTPAKSVSTKEMLSELSFCSQVAVGLYLTYRDVPLV